MLKDRLNGRIILILFMLTLFLLGCVSLTTQTGQTKTKPTRPILSSITGNEMGGICMDKRDSAALLMYIDELEQSE